MVIVRRELETVLVNGIGGTESYDQLHIVRKLKRTNFELRKEIKVKKEILTPRGRVFNKFRLPLFLNGWVENQLGIRKL